MHWAKPEACMKEILQLRQQLSLKQLTESTLGEALRVDSFSVLPLQNSGLQGLGLEGFPGVFRANCLLGFWGSGLPEAFGF